MLVALKFVVFCTSPRFTESIVMGRNLNYLMKKINVYNLYVETIFHVDACHYPLYCLTKRHDTKERRPKIIDFTFNEWLAITLIRSDKKIRTIQLLKTQLIVLIKDLSGKLNIRLTYSSLLLFASWQYNIL